MTHLQQDGPGWDEAERVAALRSFDILDTEREPAFDDIVALVARICEAPIAVVNLIDTERQWFKAEVGLGVRETPLDSSFCAQALLQQDSMVVRDATLDPRFEGNPLVTGEAGLRFYAGVLLKDEADLPIGTLCVLDTRPRPDGLSELQEQTLRTLASQVMVQLRLRRALRQKQVAEDASRRVLDAADYVGAWDWDVVEDRVVADAGFAQQYGVGLDEAEAGVPIDRFTRHVHPDDRDRLTGDIEAAMASDEPFVSEYRLIDAQGEVRWVVARGRAYRDATGKVVRFPGVSVDVTDRRRKDQRLAEIASALSESEARFRVLTDAMPQMVWSTRPDGYHDFYNARWYEFTGVPAGSSDGDEWNGLFHPEDRERAWTRWRHSLETGEPYDIEYRLRHNSGIYRWVLGRALSLRNDEGEITRWFGTCTDIHELKQLEHGRELVSQELSHRIKNVFAVVSALVALSARQHPEAKPFAASLRTRISALARAHEFVRPHTEASRPAVAATTLHAFLNALFQPYGDDDGASRVKIAGDDAVFDDQAATSVALLFHELATNAAKYGALANGDGRVDLTTAHLGERFVLKWVETGGPRVAGPPERVGFGSSLTNLSVEAQLGGKLSREWRPEGLCIVVDLPATALARRRAAGARDH
ncbi:PAS domain-containing protein [Brevundimonas sp. PAMC22021]|uniref:PAS domain-containing protein n=1 Tax=Brevundimonas sp. PAMC22021 TaxID=2861285 RepID=UPI00210447E6|nr:PAS domain-containing protein [Brevundimonas sp. PAMC22021]